MIVEFSVGNFRSIKDIQTISFVATGLKSPAETEVDDNNLVKENGLSLLKTIGIYGPNASGKSNIVKALSYFLFAIKQEASSSSNLSDLCEPFLYQEIANEKESFFQIVLLLDNKKYRYGFTIKRNTKRKESINDLARNEIITNEWLFATKEKNVVEYFTRTGIDVQKDRLPNAEKIPALPYEHSLFLNHAAAYDNESDCEKIKKFIRSRTISSFQNIMGNSVILANNNENEQSMLLGVLSAFNLNYKKIRLNREGNTKLNEITHDKIYLTKTFINESNQEIEIELNLDKNESDGTRKIFDLAGLLYVAFNSTTGGLIIIDEIDSNFHPTLLKKLIEMFNNPEINKSKTQLLFTSHDTNLMSPYIMRRDQFYLTEKKLNESTRLYSLADLKGIRNTADFAKEYLSGIYGGLPILEDYIIIKEGNND